MVAGDHHVGLQFPLLDQPLASVFGFVAFLARTRQLLLHGLQLLPFVEALAHNPELVGVARALTGVDLPAGLVFAELALLLLALPLVLLLVLLLILLLDLRVEGVLLLRLDVLPVGILLVLLVAEVVPHGLEVLQLLDQFLLGVFVDLGDLRVRLLVELLHQLELVSVFGQDGEVFGLHGESVLLHGLLLGEDDLVELLDELGLLAELLVHLLVVQLYDVVLEQGVQHLAELQGADAFRDALLDLLDLLEVLLQLAFEAVALVLVFLLVLTENGHIVELLRYLWWDIRDGLFLDEGAGGVEQGDVLFLPHEQVGQIELDFQRVVQVLLVQFGDGLADVDALLLDGGYLVLNARHLRLHLAVKDVVRAAYGLLSVHLAAQSVDLLAQIFDDGLLLAHVHGDQPFVLVGLDLDLLCPICILKGVEGLLELAAGGGGCANHDGLALATQGVLQQAREFAVSLGDEHALLVGVPKRVDAVRQREQRAVDLGAFLQPHASVFCDRAPLGTGQVDEREFGLEQTELGALLLVLDLGEDLEDGVRAGTGQVGVGGLRGASAVALEEHVHDLLRVFDLSHVHAGYCYAFVRVLPQV